METSRRNAIKLGAAAAVASVIPMTATLAASSDPAPRLRGLVRGIRNLSGDTIVVVYEQAQEIADLIEDILGDPRSASSLPRFPAGDIKSVARGINPKGQYYEFYTMDVKGKGGTG